MNGLADDGRISLTAWLIATVLVVSVSSAAPNHENEVWAPLSVMNVTNPMHFGAVGDGMTNDLPALTSAVNALGNNGGIVYLPAGRSFLKANPLTITKSHIKIWSPNQQAEIYGVVPAAHRQSVIFQNVQWGGLFGLRLRSNATSRGDQLLDHQVVSDNTTNFEVCGIEIHGSNAGGIMLYRGSSRLFIEGNVVHWTWADHIHHTSGASWSWVWGNRFENGLPSRGDDGIASVTYGADTKRNSDLEWFDNVILGRPGARGYAVVGGDRVYIHHNWAIGTSGAGLYVAAESSYDASGSTNITLDNNWLYQVAQNNVTNHAGMMCYADNGADASVRNVAFNNNVVVDTVRGQAYRNPAGFVFDISNSNMSTDYSKLPLPVPTESDITTKDTNILRTRDTWFVAEQFRNGLYRIQVRVSPTDSSAFEQRFEYVVHGTVEDIEELLQLHLDTNTSCVLGFQKDNVNVSAYLVMLSSVPLIIDSSTGASGISFEQLRHGDLSGESSWVWELLDNPQAQEGAQCLQAEDSDGDLGAGNRFYPPHLVLHFAKLLGQ